MENDFHKWLKKSLRSDQRLPVGIGDDAAVLDWAAAHQCVVTTDLLAEGVHFRLAVDGPLAVGRKSLAVNLSDVAAMACTPVAAFVSLLLPHTGAGNLAVQILKGMQPLADELDTLLAGGDTNTWPGELVVNVTVVAQPGPKGPLVRSGALVDDVLLVTGPLGGSLLGHHLTFTPQVELAQNLLTNYSLNAGMDISDGLVLDASRMAAASGCGIELDLARIPISEAARAMAKRGDRTPLDHALGDGEDFALLLAASHDVAGQIIADIPGIFVVGRCVAEAGIWQVRDGERTRCQVVGYEH